MQRYTLGVLFLVMIGTVSVAGPVAPGDVVPTPQEIDQIRRAAPQKSPAEPTQPRKLLIYTACKGFRHSSIPYATTALGVIGKQTGAFTIEQSDDPNVFQPDRLCRFDAVCFNNTTGELFDDAALKKSLLDFVRNGGGLVGIHAATDCFYEWPAFGEMIGGYFDGHPWNEEVVIRAHEAYHPVVRMFRGQPFKIADEIYQFRAPYSRSKLRVLLSLDPHRTDMTKGGIKRTDNDFAVSWIRNYGLGRVFYCSLGHRHEVFWNPTVLEHYLAGIQFALGDLPANALPSRQLGLDGWQHLFNGRDLTGWIAPSNAWAVSDGILGRVGKGGDIWSEQTYSDFILNVEFMISPDGNSGIFFRTGNIHDCVQTGIELQVLDSYGRESLGKHDCGAIYDCLEPSTNAMRSPGKWNHVKLTCVRNRIKVVMNGEPIIDMDLDNWTEPHKNPDGTDNKFRTAYKDMPRAGRIGFQNHGDAVWYRNVRIKPLGR